MLTIYYFSAPWCMPCRSFAPVVQQVSVDMSSAVNVMKIDIDQNPPMAAAFNIRSVPTVVFLNNGNEVYRFSGSISKQQLTSMIEQLSK